MTPQHKRTMSNIGVVVAAVLAVSGWAVRRGATAIDDRYVHVADFTMHQAGEAQLRLRDSSATYNEIHDIHAILSGLDSSDRCHRGYRGYCR